ncbi:MAG TPA: hypothetical protein VIU12_17400 [Chryseolinea sp.]
MKRIRDYLLVSFFLFSCASREDIYIPMDTAEGFAKLNFGPPFPEPVAYLPVFILSDHDSIYETSLFGLKIIYDKFYSASYGEFSDFIFDALNQKIKFQGIGKRMDIRKGYFEFEKFEISQSMKSIYLAKGLKGLADMYCDSYGANKYALESEIDRDGLKTLSYFFFLNRYFTLVDDVAGMVVFKQMSSLMNRRNVRIQPNRPSKSNEISIVI